MGTTPLVLVANPKGPATNVRELVALLKVKFGGYNYASSGNGTILHLDAVMFLHEAGQVGNTQPRQVCYPERGNLWSERCPASLTQ